MTQEKGKGKSGENDRLNRQSLDCGGSEKKWRCGVDFAGWEGQGFQRMLDRDEQKFNDEWSK
jgi:hypothetical protein